MTVRIAVLSDLHYSPEGTPPIPARRGEIADILLLRAVHRLNRLIRPDITLVAGDLLEDSTRPDVPAALERLRGILGRLQSPVLVIPGNHDGDSERFREALGRPPDSLDVKGVRFVTFVDAEEPGWHARRTAQGFERMERARAGYDGPIVALQHVPVFPPGSAPCPYHYVNAGDVIAAMRRLGIGLSIAGHYHKGMDLVRGEDAAFLAAPALCESPFSLLDILYSPDAPEEADIVVRRHDLRMAPELELVDCHVHTPFAYCNENMDIARAMALGRDFGLAGIGFSEHSDHLYFTRAEFNTWNTIRRNLDIARPEDCRAEDYLAALRRAGCPDESVGFEVDVDPAGRLVLRGEDRARAAYLIGAVHNLAETQAVRPDSRRAADEFIGLVRRLLRSGIQVLAHPFRIFRRRGLERPDHLFAPLAALLRETGVAAEINFHTNEPPVEFFRLCLEAGVKLTFGSDSHNLYEVGDFALHLDLLERCGYDGDVRDVLLDPRGAMVRR